MCGRFDRHSDLAAFAELVEGLVLEGAPELPPSYNVAPSQRALVIAANAEGRRKCAALDWGLVPGWVAKPGMNRPINARAETVASKPMFRQAFSRRRGLVPVDGYYEWGQTAAGKRPYYFHMPDGKPFLIGAVWDTNSRLAAERLDTFCLITREAIAATAEVHHRMPLIIAREDVDRWLDPAFGADDLATMTAPGVGVVPGFHPVSTRVNSPANDDASIIEPDQERP